MFYSKRKFLVFHFLRFAFIPGASREKPSMELKRECSEQSPLKSAHEGMRMKLWAESAMLRDGTFAEKHSSANGLSKRSQLKLLRLTIGLCNVTPETWAHQSERNKRENNKNCFDIFREQFLMLPREDEMSAALCGGVWCPSAGWRTWVVEKFMCNAQNPMRGKIEK